MKFFALCLKGKCFPSSQKRNKSKDDIKDDSKLTGQKLKGSTDMSSMFIDKSNGRNSLYVSANLDKVISVAKLNSHTSGTSHVKKHWEEQDKILCLFCGGVRCKHENYQLHKSPAINGLHSDFITPDIIASQRPSTVLINQFDLISEFKKIGIGLIVNLQREGEHPYCGPNKKLEETGYSYDPCVFEEANIKCRTQGWRELSSLDAIGFILDIVKDITTTVKINNKKVLVHCHSGNGRTGIIVCCYQIFNTILSASEMIDSIRRIRPGSLDKDAHYNFCLKYEKYIEKARVIFVNKKKNMDFFIKNQYDLSYGDDSILFKAVPKLLHYVLDRLVELNGLKLVTKGTIYQNLFIISSWTQAQEETLFELKIKLNLGEWNLIKNEAKDSEVLCRLLYDWLSQCVTNVISPKTINCIFDEKELAILITNNINHSKLFSTDNRRKLAEDIKHCLTETEFETLVCISYFLMQVSPENEREAIEYEKMLVRICASLLGFSFQTIWNNKNQLEVQGAIYYSHRLGKILKLFVIICESDLESGTIAEFSSYLNKKKFNINPKVSYKSSIMSNGHRTINDSSKHLPPSESRSIIKSSIMPQENEKGKQKEIVYMDNLKLENTNDYPNTNQVEDLKNINSLIYSHQLSSNTQLVEKPSTNSLYGSLLVAEELESIINNEILTLKENKKVKKKSSSKKRKQGNSIIEIEYDPQIIGSQSPTGADRKINYHNSKKLSLVPEYTSDEKDSGYMSKSSSSSRKHLFISEEGRLDKGRLNVVNLFDDELRSNESCK